MIQKGANVNLQSTDGTTALILAAIYGQKDQIEALIAAGARLDIADYVSLFRVCSLSLDQPKGVYFYRVA